MSSQTRATSIEDKIEDRLEDMSAVWNPDDIPQPYLTLHQLRAGWHLPSKELPDTYVKNGTSFDFY